MGNGDGIVIRRHRGVFVVLAAGTLLLGALACEDSDKIPPAESTISLAATPSTILLSGGIQAGDVDILATVYSPIGVPLPDQDVRFTTSDGTLCLSPRLAPDDCRPGAGVPIETDSIGNAHVILTSARTNTTITAKSGTATADLQLTTATCQIQAISLEPNLLEFTTCGDNPELTATVIDSDGEPCQDVTVAFESTVDPADLTDEDIKFVFTAIGSNRTDGDGQVTVRVTLDSRCTTICPNLDCNPSAQQIRARVGTIESDNTTDVSIDIN